MGVPYIRQMIADLPNAEIFSATGDGLTNLFILPNTPIQTGTEVVSLNGTVFPQSSNWTVNESTGLLMFTSAPANTVAISVFFSWTFFTDTNLQAYLDAEGDDYRAAAQALDTWATNAAMVQRKIKLLDLETDGPAVAESLRDHAKTLRQQSASLASVDWAEMVVDDFGYRQRIWDEYLRGA